MTMYEQIRKNAEINTYITQADRTLQALGYTEHSFAHVSRVSAMAGDILQTMGHDAHTVELARIAGYIHDIGNVVNRVAHSQSGALMAFRILDHSGMSPEDIAIIVSAIGNHDEGTGVPEDEVSAALLHADKSDARRTRVPNTDISTFDIHDRVNYSVEKSELIIGDDKKSILLRLTVDPQYSSIMDYFEIFLGRMTMCRRAAERLGMRFKLEINGQQLL